MALSVQVPCHDDDPGRGEEEVWVYSMQEFLESVEVPVGREVHIGVEVGHQRSHPIKPGAQVLGVRKGTTASGKPTGASRATGPGEARRTTRGHESRQRGTPLAGTKAHGQVPSNDSRRVPQTRRMRTTRNEPRHENSCQATPAAVRRKVCAPGGYPAPAGYEQQPSGWTSVHPEGTQPLPATNSRRPDGRVCAPQHTAQHTERAAR